MVEMALLLPFTTQFISRTMVVTGGAVVNLVLNPFDTVPLIVYELVLVR